MTLRQRTMRGYSSNSNSSSNGTSTSRTPVDPNHSYGSARSSLALIFVAAAVSSQGATR